MTPRLCFRAALFAAAAASVVPGLQAWDGEGHQIVNRLALAALPADFPAFVKTRANAERIVFLGAEPDRWSHAPNLTLKHYNWPDHYLDLEDLTTAGLDPRTVPSMRYDFVIAFAAARAAHADRFPKIDPARNTDRTRELSGFLPWTISEYFGKLQSAFASLNAYEQTGGTPEEIANAQADVIYIMGILGHYVGDGAEPLHTTAQFNGWVGPNPNGFTTWNGFHSWIDSGFMNKAGIRLADLSPRVRPAPLLPLDRRQDGRDPFFAISMDYLLDQFKLVEPLYRLEKEGKLNRDDRPANAEGKAFIEGQLLKGGEMLASVWATAWRTAPVDTYLVGVLTKRRDAAAAGKKAAP